MFCIVHMVVNSANGTMCLEIKVVHLFVSPMLRLTNM